MKSSIVVVSWWSNCLALRCIENLLQYAPERNIFVVQNGKSKQTRSLFSALLSPAIHEIDYPDDAPAEHFSVIEHVIKKTFPDEEGLWFVDHDAFLLEEAESFFKQMDISLAKVSTCMFTPAEHPITVPAFWLSPVRMPPSCPSFAPYPPIISDVSRYPYILEKDALLTTPKYDTLVLAQNYLAKRKLASVFPLPFFPNHSHLGGLHAFLRSNADIVKQAQTDEKYRDFLREKTLALNAFYSSCLPQWVSIEEPSLLEKLNFVSTLFGRESE